ncbi:MAG: alanine racemase [Nocardioidaceae bacterium]
MTRQSTTPAPLDESLARIESEPLGPWFRNIPDTGGTVGSLGAAGWNVTDLLLPTLTLKQEALDHNAALFRRWCAEAGVDYAPHGKTSMSPQLIAKQLGEGAWGITAATVAQARLMHAWGVRRVVIANEVVDRAGLGWLGSRSAADPDFEVLVLADSVDGVDRVAAGLSGADPRRPLPVLVELGVPGGRAGARTTQEAAAVARRVTASPQLELAGVECYEGVYPQDRAPTSVAQVDEFAVSLRDLVIELDAAGLFADRDEIVLTAGGSAYPDRVVAAWASLPELSRPVRKVVRSGAYLTHDHGLIERVSPLGTRAGHRLGSMRPAMELWASVLSTPEPGLAICGFGKRDASFDIDLPVPLARLDRAGQRSPLQATTVESLNDQHAFVRHPDALSVGDIVVFGLSHPCTALDKWPLIPLIDDADRVVGAARTYF